jgi:hypothetical protein
MIRKNWFISVGVLLQFGMIVSCSSSSNLRIPATDANYTDGDTNSHSFEDLENLKVPLAKTAPVFWADTESTSESPVNPTKLVACGHLYHGESTYSAPDPADDFYIFDVDCDSMKKSGTGSVRIDRGDLKRGQLGHLNRWLRSAAETGVQQQKSQSRGQSGARQGAILGARRGSPYLCISGEITKPVCGETVAERGSGRFSRAISRTLKFTSIRRNFDNHPDGNW